MSQQRAHGRGSSQPLLESDEISGLRGVEECVAESLPFGGCDLRAPSVGEVQAGAGDQLPRVGLAHGEHVCDLPVGVVERLAEHVGGSLDGGKLLQEREHCAPERFGPLRGECGIGFGVDRLWEPRADVGLATRSGRLADVDRESRRGGGKKGGGVPYLAAIGALPAHPRVLHHVVRFRGTLEHAVGDTEETRADRLERGGVGLGHLRVRAHAIARCDSTAMRCGVMRPVA